MKHLINLVPVIISTSYGNFFFLLLLFVKLTNTVRDSSSDFSTNAEVHRKEVLRSVLALVLHVLCQNFMVSLAIESYLHLFEGSQG